MELLLQPGKLTLADLRQAYHQPIKVKLDESASAAINASVACVEKIVNEGRTAYGINTGFGLLASTKIAPEDLEKLQRSLVLSHAAGVGEPLDDAMVRLIMLLKANSLARGFSGIRRKVIDALLALINAEVYPHIPLKALWELRAIWRHWPICRWYYLVKVKRAIKDSGFQQLKPLK